MSFIIEILFEFIAELFTYSAYELTLSRKVPLWIRALLALFLLLFFALVLGGLTLMGFYLIVNQNVAGWLMAPMGLFLIIGLIRKVSRDIRSRALH